MNKTQKSAWINLLAAVSMVLSGGAMLILNYIVGMPKAWFGMVFMFLMGLGYFIKEDSRDKVPFDELDLLIQKRSSSIGYTASYGFFAAFCFVVYSVVGKGGMVSVDTLLIMTLGGVVVLLSVQSIATLVQYRWGGNHGE